MRTLILSALWILGCDGLATDPAVDPQTDDATLGAPDARTEEVQVGAPDAASGSAPMEVPACDAPLALAVAPIRLDFGRVPVGEVQVLALTLRSEGGQPIEITALDLDPPDGAFEINAQRPLHLGQEAITVQVRFAPAAEGPRVTTLHVRAERAGCGDHSMVAVALSGEGITLGCPRAALVEPGPLHVRVLGIVALDARPSVPAEGLADRPLTSSWVVLHRPTGSTSSVVERISNPRAPLDAPVPDDITTPEASFVADLAGRYLLEVRVGDAHPREEAACPEARAQLELIAEPDQAIHIELFWHTPADVDETDATGSDLDLHLLHPAAADFAPSPWHCAYDNGAPDWGADGPDGNPSLDLDDTNGAGPENINVRVPEDTAALGGTYRVGVVYYNAENPTDGTSWGPSEATVRIFLDGVLAGEWVHTLTEASQLWEVARIVWTDGDHHVETVDPMPEP